MTQFTSIPTTHFSYLKQYVETSIGNKDNLALLKTALDNPSLCSKGTNIYFQDLSQSLDYIYAVGQCCGINNFDEVSRELKLFLNQSPWQFDVDKEDFFKAVH